MFLFAVIFLTLFLGFFLQHNNTSEIFLVFTVLTVRVTDVYLGKRCLNKQLLNFLVWLQKGVFHPLYTYLGSQNMQIFMC